MNSATAGAATEGLNRLNLKKAWNHRCLKQKIWKKWAQGVIFYVRQYVHF
jgi:hypothetical protein